jgi:glutamate-1-semialdehyde 2,1-aminomutase
VRNLVEAQKSDTNLFRTFFQGMLAQGIYLPPSQFEACFISLAHGAVELEETLLAFKNVWQRW